MQLTLEEGALQPRARLLSQAEVKDSSTATMVEHMMLKEMTVKVPSAEAMAAGKMLRTRLWPTRLLTVFRTAGWNVHSKSASTEEWRSKESQFMRYGGDGVGVATSLRSKRDAAGLSEDRIRTSS